jgi:hypothetical protein
VTHTTGSTRSRMGLLALLAAIGCFAACAAFPGGAAASTVTCHGKTSPTDSADAVVKNQIDYAFTCTEPIMSYSIIVNRSVTYFNTETQVFFGRPEKDQISPTESFGCEGPIPGNGIGCKGHTDPADALGNRWVVSSIGTDQNPCARHAKGDGFKAWVVVTTQEADATGKPFLISSEPFRLYGPGCSKTGQAHHRLRA